MKQIGIIVLAMASTLSGSALANDDGDLIRTVIFAHQPTAYGQNLLIIGGHDPSLVGEHYEEEDEPIYYNNTRNAWSARIKVKDRTLDWDSLSAMDWTTDFWPGDWGPKQTYKDNGTGEDPENQWGHHYWKFDVMMEGEVGDWFEFRVVLKDDYGEEYEGDIVQEGAPHQTPNHWAKKGYMTIIDFNSDDVEFIPLY